MARGQRKPTKHKRPVLSGKMIGVVLGVGIVLSIGAFLFGNSDKGVIDVSGVINESNVAARESIERGEAPQAPIVDTRPKSLNGGLIGSGKPEELPPPTPEVEGASTTDAQASSTESGEESSGEATEEGSDETGAEANDAEAEVREDGDTATEEDVNETNDAG